LPPMKPAGAVRQASETSAGRGVAAGSSRVLAGLVSLAVRRRFGSNGRFRGPRLSHAGTGAWPEVRTRFLALVHVANHNAHHLGQIVLLRQLMGRWPPPSGSWTW
jgi:hypothetical protein